MKRVVIPELLDTDSGTPAEVAASLSDLRQINQRFGGIATTRGMIERVAQATKTKSLSLLEVAAGAGDVPRMVQQSLERRGIRLEITLLDRAWSHLANGHSGGTQAVVGDALALPFRDASFDLVSCCLFAHHLSPEQVVALANEALRVCRSAILLNDLIRHRLHLALVYSGLPLFHSPITRHDAVASVRRAYTVDEMRTMLEQSTAARIEIHRHYLFRMGAVVWKA